MKKTKPYTAKDVREYNVNVYSTGKSNEWYVRLWLGERKSHGVAISDTYKTKPEAETKADEIAKYIAPLFKTK